MAIRLGDAEKALEFFRENASLDLDNSHGNTRDGIHAANMGGAWMAFVQGFGGFIPGRDAPGFTPRLPSDWKSLTYRVCWQESMIHVVADHKKVKLSLEGGSPLNVEVFGRNLSLRDRLEVSNP